MIIVMSSKATERDVSAVADGLIRAGTEPVVMTDGGRTVIMADLPDHVLGSDLLRSENIERVIRVSGPTKLVTRSYSSRSTVVDVAGVAIGGGTFVVAAGPCAVESFDQMIDTAMAVASSGARLLRGDAFKPRTSPYAFQGLGENALKILVDARDRTGLPFVAEVVDPRDVELVGSHADMLRIGTRNMSNHSLLREVGGQHLPVQLKRGRTATVEEWLSAAEYIYAAGNPNIVLVERGIRTFEPLTRNTLDLSAVPLVKELSHLPVMVDPSHAVGRSDLVPAMARAALVVGADGLLIDVHPDPGSALVDGEQALTFEAFDRLMADLRSMAPLVGMSL